MSDLLKFGISYLTTDGQYFCLFLVSLLVIFFLEKKRGNLLLWLSALLTLLVACPATALLLNKYQTYFYKPGHLGILLPISLVISYGITLTFGWISNNYKTKYRVAILTGSSILVLVLLTLSGSLSILPAVKEQTTNKDYTSYTVIDDTFSLLPVLEDKNITIIACDEMLTRARIYDGQDFLLPYGRNMWEDDAVGYTFDSYNKSLIELHEWYNDFRRNDYVASLNTQMLNYMLTTDIDYCIFDKYRLIVGDLEASLAEHPAYTLYAQNDYYCIYKLDKQYVDIPDTGWVLSSYADRSGMQSLFYTLYNNNDGTLIVIDGGWAENAEYVKKVIKGLGGNVTAWYITHYHNDHVDAFNEIYSNPGDINIEAVYSPYVDPDYYRSICKDFDTVDSFNRFLELTDGKDRVYHPVRNDIVEYNGLTITIANTYDDFVDDVESYDVPNDLSMMLRIDGSKKSALICGDVSTASFCGKYTGSYANYLDVDIVQAGHHGNNYFPYEWYNYVSPEAVLIDAPISITTDPALKTKSLIEYLTNEKGAPVYDYQTAPNHFVLD